MILTQLQLSIKFKTETFPLFLLTLGVYHQTHCLRFKWFFAAFWVKLQIFVCFNCLQAPQTHSKTLSVCVCVCVRPQAFPISFFFLYVRPKNNSRCWHSQQQQRQQQLQQQPASRQKIRSSLLGADVLCALL